MHWFFLCLSLIWTSIFGFMFFLLFPNVMQQPQFKFNPQQQQVVQQQSIPLPCVRETPKPLQQFSAENDVPVPIDKDTPPAPIELKKVEEIPPTPKTEAQIKSELEAQAQTAFEQRLVRILVKINVASCSACTRDDKKIILQLKMMKALLDGKPKEALKYSEELNKYLGTTRIEILPKKPVPSNTPKLKPKPRTDDEMPLPPPL